MSRAVTKKSPPRLPKEVAEFFEYPALIGDEKREDYDRFSSAVTDSIEPSDVVHWVLVSELIALCWEIKRERKIKVGIIRNAELSVATKILKKIETEAGNNPLRIRELDSFVRLWSTDAEARRLGDERLFSQGYDQSSIWAQAFVDGAENIDAVDRRIASYERRRSSLFKDIAEYSASLARRLETTTSSVIEGEFTDVPE